MTPGIKMEKVPAGDVLVAPASWLKKISPLTTACRLLILATDSWAGMNMLAVYFVPDKAFKRFAKTGATVARRSQNRKKGGK